MNHMKKSYVVPEHRRAKKHKINEHDITSVAKKKNFSNNLLFYLHTNTNTFIIYLCEFFSFLFRSRSNSPRSFPRGVRFMIKNSFFSKKSKKLAFFVHKNSSKKFFLFFLLQIKSSLFFIRKQQKSKISPSKLCFFL
jgi:hypothetical protein